MRRRWIPASADWLIATSTPPFTVSVRTAPAAAPSSPVAAVTGARKSSTGSPSAVADSRSSTAFGSASGSARSALPVWARTAPFASRITPPTTSLPACPLPLADTAPSRNCTSSGLSSVRTPYLALKARFVAM